jgi:hypothetical protein
VEAAVHQQFQIADLARARGVDTVIDTAHAFGQFPLSLPELGVPFAILHCHAAESVLRHRVAERHAVVPLFRAGKERDRIAIVSSARLSPEVLAHITSLIPMGRVGQPEEVAALVSWLSSDEVSFSTGAVYDISGGRATY